MTRRLMVLVLAIGAVAVGEDPISGKWDMTMDTPGGERKASPVFKLEGDKVSGKWDASEVQGSFKEGKLELEFPLASSEAGYQAKFKVSAKLDGGVLSGTWSFASYDGRLTGKRQ